MYFKKFDIFIYIFLLTFFVVLTYIINISKQEKSDFIEIYIKGKLSYKYRLTIEEQIIEIETGLGKEKIIIKDKKVKKIQSNCPKKICMKHEINENGGMIICIPSETVIKLAKDEEKYDYILK